MRTVHRPIALLLALLSLAGPAALLADELDPLQQLTLDDGTTGGSSPKPCGYGSRISCGTTTTETCTERTLQPSVGPGGVSFTWYCLTKQITVRTDYKDT